MALLLRVQTSSKVGRLIMTCVLSVEMKETEICVCGNLQQNAILCRQMLRVVSFAKFRILSRQMLCFEIREAPAA